MYNTVKFVKCMLADVAVLLVLANDTQWKLPFFLSFQILEWKGLLHILARECHCSSRKRRVSGGDPLLFICQHHARQTWRCRYGNSTYVP